MQSSSSGLLPTTTKSLAHYVLIVEEQTGFWVLSGNGHRIPGAQGQYYGFYITPDGSFGCNVEEAALGVFDNINRALISKKLQLSDLYSLVVYLTPNIRQVEVSSIIKEKFPHLHSDNINYKQVSQLPLENVIEISATACTYPIALQTSYPKYSYTSSAKNVTKAVLEVFRNCLVELSTKGLSLENISGVTLEMQTQDQYVEMNQIWNRLFYDSQQAPTRTCVFVATNPNIVQIDVRAVPKIISKVNSMLLQ